VKLKRISILKEGKFVDVPRGKGMPKLKEMRAFEITIVSCDELEIVSTSLAKLIILLFYPPQRDES
jgi:threonyl-tRNA synthetase